MREGEFNFNPLPQEPPETKRQKVVITGGTEGIGRALTEEFLKNEDEVAICARTKDRLVEMQQHNPELKAEEVDLSNRHAAQGFIDQAIDEMGGIDLLILNAAISGIPHQGETPEQKKERQDAVFKINQVAQVALTRAAFTTLQQSQGTIVFITSGLARMETKPPGSEDYARSKARIEQYFHEFLRRPGNEGVTMFSINPGPVDTRMHEEIAKHGPEALATMSRMAKEKNILRDPEIIGKIITRLATTKTNLNPNSGEYDLAIENGSVIDITPAHIAYESSFPSTS